MPALPVAMTRKSGQKCLEENKDEQAISEAALTKIIGSAGVYDLEVKCNMLHISSLSIVKSLLNSLNEISRSWSPQIPLCVP